MNGYPGFLAAKAMPDGKIAVAIDYGDEVLVGTVSLNGMNITSRQFSSETTGARDKLKLQLFLNGGNFLAIPKSTYDELNYYRSIPEYRNVNAKPLLQIESK